MTSFMNSEEIAALNFKFVGENVKISRKACFYGTRGISIGDNSRIDDFVLLSAGPGGISIGRHVHIACFVSMIGGGTITLEDYSAISGKCSVYSSSDPYDGSCMTNPCVPEPFRTTYNLPVTLGKHVVIGAGSTILPGVTLETGCAVGAMTLVNKSFPPNKMILGIPAREIRDRSLYIYDLEKLFDEQNNNKETK